MKNFSDI